MRAPARASFGAQRRAAGCVREQARVALPADPITRVEQEVDAGLDGERRRMRNAHRARRVERVADDDAVEAERAAQQSGHDRLGEHGRPPACIEFRVGGARHHHELHAGRDRAPEGIEPAL